MGVVGLPKPFNQFSKRVPRELTPQAQERMRWVKCWQGLRDRGLSAAEAAEALGLPRSTLYRWDKALREEGPAGLLDKSRRPKRVRRPTWSVDLSRAVLKLREKYPRWGKDKLAPLLRDQGWKVSTSMVGRILGRLKARGVLKEPPRYGILARRRCRPRPYGIRKPREYQAKEPGDIVQVDTLDVLEVHTRATSSLAVWLLESMRRRFPFPI